jgi:hypothetical protein
MAKRKVVYWAFCCYAVYEGRLARGFVLASNQHDAMKKARKRVRHEKRRAEREWGLENGDLGVPRRRGRYAVRVWRDPHKATAPRSKHYTERRAS